MQSHCMLAVFALVVLLVVNKGDATLCLQIGPLKPVMCYSQYGEANPISICPLVYEYATVPSRQV